MRFFWFAMLLVSCGGSVSSPTAQNDASVDDAADSVVTVSAACAARAKEVCRGFGTCDDFYLGRWYADRAACEAGEQQICERDVDVPGVVDGRKQIEACTEFLRPRSCPGGATALFCGPRIQRGTLADGSSCIYDEQCEGGLCTLKSDTSDGIIVPGCGRCARRAELSDPCSDASDRCDVVSTTLRSSGLVCDVTAGRCVARLPAGATCTFADACDTGLGCMDGKCTPTLAGSRFRLLPSGAPCNVEPNTFCSGGEWCKRTSGSGPGVCTPPFAEGEGCFVYGTCGHVNVCAPSDDGKLRCQARRPSCAG